MIFVYRTIIVFLYGRLLPPFLRVGIFFVNGDVYIKELGNQCLISHNEKYRPIHIGESDSVYCCGRVIGIV